MVNKEDRGEVIFKIEKHIGVIATYPTGWTKELNMVSWNKGNPKFDIRDWDKNHEHMSRGITLHEDEMKRLKEML